MRRVFRGAAFRVSFVAATFALLVAAPREAAAQDANGLGEKHQLILSADRLLPLLSYTSQTVTATVGGASFKTTDSGTSAAFLFGREPNLGVVHTIPRVAFDYTIVRRLTIGGAFAFALGLGGTHTEDLANGTVVISSL